MLHTSYTYFVDRVETILVFASRLKDTVGTETKTDVSNVLERNIARAMQRGVTYVTTTGPGKSANSNF
jgi:hypothetical protein